MTGRFPTIRRVRGEHELAALVRRARATAGMTQFDLAVAVGLKQNVSVSRYENGHSVPDPQIMERIVAVLGLNPDEAWRAWGIAYAARVRRGLAELSG